MPRPSDWHPQRVIAELRMRRTSASQLAKREGRSRSWTLNAIHDRLASEQAERVIAAALDLPAHHIWPSRYHPDGTRIDGRAERHRNPTAWARRRNAQKGRAA